MRLAHTIAAALIAAAVLAPCAFAGVYQVAYWRELGAYENQAPPAGEFGLHDVWIHVWNEDGTPRSGVPIENSSGFNWGTTDANGILHIQLWSSASDFLCVDGNPSEVTPVFDENRWPHSGHYSWEVGFVYRTSSTPTGIFDLNYDGVLNSTSGDHCYIDAPCTRSLAFISTKPDEACSDQFADSASVTEAGQTFVAAGDRVIAAKAWVSPSTGYNAQIVDGGPTGTPIGPVAVATGGLDYEQTLAKWSFDAVPVVPGNTYYLKITATGGGSFTAKRTLNDNYSGGCFYENKAARSGYDMMGAVVMAWSGYGSSGRIAGLVRNTTGSPLAGAVVAAEPGGHDAQTDTDGYYTMFDVPAGTYTVTASKWNYSEESLHGRVVTAGSTKTINFDQLAPLTNVLANPGFESGLSNWTVHDTFNAYDSGEHAVPSHGGDRWAGEVVSGGGGIGGAISQQVAVSGDYEYMLRAWMLTDSFNGDRDVEFPMNNVCRIGIDPTGSGVRNATGTVWTSYQSSHNTWSEVTVEANAQPPYSQMTVWLEYWIGNSHDWNKAGLDDAFFGRSAPIIIVDTGPTVSDIQATSAVVSWHTNVDSDSRVDYGLTAAHGDSKTVSESVTDHSVTIGGLLPDTTYHFMVTSAAAGYTSGSSDDSTFETAGGSVIVPEIIGLDALPDGTEVVVPGKLVTAGVDQLGNKFYIQEPDFFRGIRANYTDSSVHEGDIRDVYGVLNTIDDERCIDCTCADLVSSGNPVPGPYGILLGEVGGEGVGHVGVVNTVGSLVRTWGTVGTKGYNYFMLQNADGYKIKVFCGLLSKPSGFAAVTGCCGTTMYGGGVIPGVHARKQSDIDDP